MKLKTLGYAAVLTIATVAFVLGTAGSSEAAKKKAKAAAPQQRGVCMFDSNKPVCATKGGMKFTYANACYAMDDGAVVKSQKACPTKKAKKAKKAKKSSKKK